MRDKAQSDGCLLHPEEPVLAVCERLGRSYCASCLKQGLARCLRPTEPCRHRPYCLVRQYGFWLRERAAGFSG